MCSLQQLHQSKEGHVVHCRGCRHYQLLFGGVVLSMSEEEFQKFNKAVTAFKNDLLLCDNDCDVPMPTMRQGVHLLLNQHKIANLHALLEAADAEAKALEMMQLFQP